MVFRKGAIMAVSSPRLISLATGNKVDPEELGGWRVHAEVSGLADQVVDTDEQAIDAIKRFLSYLPRNVWELPPVTKCDDPITRQEDELIRIVPRDKRKPYNMRRVLELIADKDTLFEIQPTYGRSCITTLARMGGYVVGFIANNPLFKGGALDADACNKVTSFMVLCDSYNIPLVYLVDVPGFLIGLEGELRGMPGKVINWMNAMTLVTVPKITVMMRKNYGQAFINMAGGKNADEIACWPTADLGFMDPAVSVNVLYGVKYEDDPEKFKKLKAEVERDTSAWGLAELYEAQNVIDPRDTREYLIRTLEVHRMRLKNGVGEHLLRNWPTSY